MRIPPEEIRLRREMAGLDRVCIMEVSDQRLPVPCQAGPHEKTGSKPLGIVLTHALPQENDFW